MGNRRTPRNVPTTFYPESNFFFYEYLCVCSFSLARFAGVNPGVVDVHLDLGLDRRVTVLGALLLAIRGPTELFALFCCLVW